MTKKVKWLRIMFITALVMSGLILGGSYYMLQRMISRYVPTKPHLLQAMSNGRHYFGQHQAEHFSFASGDGITLEGRLITAEKPKGTVVFCHGFQRNKEHMARFGKLFDRYNQLFFDFRACGQSQGDYCSIGGHEYRDVIAAVNVVKQRNLARPIFIFGLSMGASAAIKAMRFHPGLVDGLILDSPYARLEEVVYDVFGNMTGLPHFPFLPIMSLMFRAKLGDEAWAMEPEKEIVHIKEPIFLIHSSTDGFTNAQHSVRLFAKADHAKSKARLWIGPPAKHGRLYDKYASYYRYKIKKFLRKARKWLKDALGREVVWRPTIGS